MKNKIIKCKNRDRIHFTRRNQPIPPHWRHLWRSTWLQWREIADKSSSGRPWCDFETFWRRFGWRFRYRGKCFDFWKWFWSWWLPDLFGKFLKWFFLFIFSLTWNTYTPTGEKAFETIEQSNFNDRGFHADGEHANPLKLYFHGGSTGIQLLQVTELRWVWKNANPVWSCSSSYIGYVTPSG